jgi:hypothetical protein
VKGAGVDLQCRKIGSGGSKGFNGFRVQAVQKSSA